MSKKDTIVVSSLRIMEDIVDRDPDLGWDGWDVLMYSKKHTSFMNKKAVFRDGKWKRVERYPAGEEGWTIPESLV